MSMVVEEGTYEFFQPTELIFITSFLLLNERLIKPYTKRYFHKQKQELQSRHRIHELVLIMLYSKRERWSRIRALRNL
jgi:hypothetical protein